MNETLQKIRIFVTYSSAKACRNMRERTDATTSKSAIQCIEVLISRSCNRNSSHNIFRTLSLYSLENQPVRKGRSLHNSEIFHFMTYDWNRTIKNLLEDSKVPYAIVQNFSAPNICNGIAEGSLTIAGNEAALLSAMSRLSGHFSVAGSDPAAGLPENEESRLMLDERLH